MARQRRSQPASHRCRAAGRLRRRQVDHRKSAFWLCLFFNDLAGGGADTSCVCTPRHQLCPGLSENKTIFSVFMTGDLSYNRSIMSENLTPLSGPSDTRTPARWAQVDRAAIEDWGKLMLVNPRAASLLAFLVSRMGSCNSVTASQKTLGKLMGVHERTIGRAVRDLAKARWIQVVRVNGPGTVAAYNVNAKVAWTQSRDKLSTAEFYTTVIADRDDQKDEDSVPGELRPLPRLLRGERQLPAGAGLPPPSEPGLPGLEPDLPALVEEERYGEPVPIGALVGRLVQGHGEPSEE